MAISLPVITRIQVADYQLYPGKNGDGIDWPLQKGVNVVAGVNGLGKTTLLNILFRLLAGPKDWRIDDGPLGNLDRNLRPTREGGFFRTRVQDGAVDAVATAEIVLGGVAMTVARRLKDLKLVEFKVAGAPQPLSEESYTAAVLKASNLSSAFDFHLVLRLLVFYLEDRRPLLWDRTAQDEVLRAVIYPRAQAGRVAEHANAVQKLDSEFRNQRVFLNQQAELLEDAEAASATDAAAVSEFNSLRTRVKALTERREALDGSVRAADTERVTIRASLQRAKLRHEEVRREHHAARQSFFSTLYPGITDVGRYILVNLDGGSGCLVCGNRRKDAGARLARCAAEGVCPVCDAPPRDQDIPPRKTTARDARTLTRLETALEEVDRERQALEASLQAAQDRYFELYEEQLIVDGERLDAERELDVLGAALPPPDQDIEALRRLVKDLQAKQAVLKRRREEREAELRSDLATGRRAVLKMAEAIIGHFRRNAAAFLAEKCELTVVQEDRKFGDGTGVFRVPRFTVNLTSGVFKAQAQPRKTSTEVSESQKEFIDLAFRLAVIQTIMGSRPAMVIIETPEASLDSVFIARAGRLLSRFAETGGAIGSRLIASSNLNKEDMIPALFGLASEEDYLDWWADRRRKTQPPSSAKAVPLELRPPRILNLLDVAAENRSVEENRAAYTLRLRRAIDPPWSHPLGSRGRKRGAR